MKAIDFKERVEPLISEIEDVILSMPDKGDSERESQKICLINSLNNFYYTVNGVEDSDFIDDEDEDD
jgi:hypothetical protein